MGPESWATARQRSALGWITKTRARKQRSHLCSTYEYAVRRPNMRGTTMSDITFQIIAIALYFAAMIAIGVYAARKTSSHEDYMLGGRNLNPFTAALSAGASDMSGWLMLGLPGAIYARRSHRGLDRHRPHGRRLPELAVRRAATARLHRGVEQLDHHPELLREPPARPHATAAPRRWRRHPRVLHVLRLLRHGRRWRLLRGVVRRRTTPGACCSSRA